MTTTINSLVERFDHQFFYEEPVGTYLITLPDQLLLFDLPSYSAELADYLVAKQKPINVLLSHGSCGIADGTLWQKKLNVHVYLHQLDQNHAWLKMNPDKLFITPPSFHPSLEVIFTPGHSPGSVCLIEKKTKTLFSGDTFGGTLNGQVRDFRNEDHNYDDIPTRLASCRRLLEYDFETVLPFHYSMIPNHGKSALAHFLS